MVDKIILTSIITLLLSTLKESDKSFIFFVMANVRWNQWYISILKTFNLFNTSLRLDFALQNTYYWLSVCLSVCLSFQVFIHIFTHINFFRITDSSSTILYIKQWRWFKFVQIKGNVLCQREIIATLWKDIDDFFSRTTGPISTKPGREHPWVKGLSFFQMKDLAIFLRGDNSYKLKIYIDNFKIFFRTAWPISTKHKTKYSWVKDIQICSI